MYDQNLATAALDDYNADQLEIAADDRESMSGMMILMDIFDREYNLGRSDLDAAGDKRYDLFMTAEAMMSQRPEEYWRGIVDRFQELKGM